VNDELRLLCNDTRELFDWLPMAAKRSLAGTPSLAHVLPGLLAKARSDFLALADLTWSDRTSGCAALGRVFLEDVVNLFYVSSGDLAEQERRATEALCHALVEEEKHALLLEAYRNAEGWEEPLDLKERELTNAALASALDAGSDYKSPWACEVLKMLGAWTAQIPQYPGIRSRLRAIDAHPAVKRNLVGAYCRYYGSFSGFVHGTAALLHITRAEDGRIGLSKGRLCGHTTPLITALLFAPDFLTRYDALLECAADGAIAELARKRWEELGKLSFADEE